MLRLLLLILHILQLFLLLLLVLLGSTLDALIKSVILGEMVRAHGSQVSVMWTIVSGFRTYHYMSRNENMGISVNEHIIQNRQQLTLDHGGYPMRALAGVRTVQYSCSCPSLGSQSRRLTHPLQVSQPPIFSWFYWLVQCGIGQEDCRILSPSVRQVSWVGMTLWLVAQRSHSPGGCALLV